MSDSRWHFVCRLQKGGHRIFLDKHNQSAPVICDNSGEFPHETDDGPLYLDFKRKLQVGGYGKPSGLTIPVTDSPNREGRYFTGESMEGSMKLMEMYPTWDIQDPKDKDFLLLAEFVRKVQQRIKIEVPLADLNTEEEALKA